jgi:hypothetical protein
MAVRSGKLGFDRYVRESFEESFDSLERNGIIPKIDRMAISRSMLTDLKQSDIKLTHVSELAALLRKSAL